MRAQAATKYITVQGGVPEGPWIGNRELQRRLFQFVVSLRALDGW